MVLPGPEAEASSQSAYRCSDAAYIVHNIYIYIHICKDRYSKYVHIYIYVCNAYVRVYNYPLLFLLVFLVILSLSVSIICIYVYIYVCVCTSFFVAALSALCLFLAAMLQVPVSGASSEVKAHQGFCQNPKCRSSSCTDGPAPIQLRTKVYVMCMYVCGSLPASSRLPLTADCVGVQAVA